MNIAILTCEDLPNLTISDQLLVPAFAKHNIIAKPAIWNDITVNWKNFDALIFRNTWDYYQKQVAFDSFLQKIENLGIKTLNAINIINQNKHKFYLQDFEKLGIKIIPTIFIRKTQNLNLAAIIPSHWRKAVIKPAYSAGSYQTELFDVENIATINAQYKSIASQKDLLLQEFMPEIKSIGETSFIFFNKKFSHAVNKKPKNDDFRIQQQFGGIYTLVQPSQEIIEQAQKIINLFPDNLLYARVDAIIIDQQLHLMELECLEPDLYFNLAENSVQKFVDAAIELI